MNRRDKLLKKIEFDERFYVNEGVSYLRSAKYENYRLKPILLALIEIIEMIGPIVEDYSPKCDGTFNRVNKALAKLDAEMEKMK